MRIGIGLGLSICLLLCVTVVKADDSLQGTWKLKSGEANGKPLASKEIDGGMLFIKGDHYRVKFEGKEPITGTQKLVFAAEGNTIDIMDDSGAHKGQVCHGIFELKGDEFRVAFAAAGKPRPTKFSTAEGDGSWMHVWKRAKE